MMVVVTGEEYFVDKYLKIHFRTTIHNRLSSCSASGIANISLGTTFIAINCSRTSVHPAYCHC